VVPCSSPRAMVMVKPAAQIEQARHRRGSHAITEAGPWMGLAWTASHHLGEAEHRAAG